MLQPAFIAILIITLMNSKLMHNEIMTCLLRYASAGLGEWWTDESNIQINEVCSRERKQDSELHPKTEDLMMFNAVILINRCESDEVHFNQHHFPTLRQKYRHFDESFINGCSGNCHFDTYQCSKWRKFRHKENIPVSVLAKLKYT